MASLTCDKSGNRRIQFLDGDARRTISLGDADKKTADGVRLHVERLINARQYGQPLAVESAAWLAAVGDTLHARIAAVGLAEPRRPAAERVTIDTLTADYIARRSDLKKHTIKNFGQARVTLLKFFGPTTTADAINRGQANDYRRYLEGRKLAEATISTNIKKCRQMFTDAIDRDVLTVNPFAKVRAGGQTNRTRQHFIDAATTQTILDACPDAEWRLIVALARFGGLRCPSEHLALTWADVFWHEGKLRVPSGKTARQGKAERFVPLFPELRQALHEAFDAARVGAVYVIDKSRNPDVNWRTHFQRILRRGGVPAWPRLFHNLRSSRQTELAREYSLRAVCDWIGNSPAIAHSHYLQTTDDEFQRAVRGPAATPTPATGIDVQNPTQQPSEMPRVRRNLHAAAVEIAQKTNKPPKIEGLDWPLPGSNRHSLAGTGF